MIVVKNSGRRYIRVYDATTKKWKFQNSSWRFFARRAWNQGLRPDKDRIRWNYIVGCLKV